jgi:hypothetical protein
LLINVQAPIADGIGRPPNTPRLKASAGWPRAFPFFTETLYLFVFTQFRTENRYALFLELL